MSPTDFFSEKEYQPWTLAQIYADMGAAGDIARALNIPVGRVKTWMQNRESNHCPLPIRMFGPTNVYSIQEWQDWYTAYMDNHKWLVGYCAENPSLADEARRFFGE